MKKPITGFCIVLGVLFALSLAGCGSGNPSATSSPITGVPSAATVVGGRATISLRWPDAAASQGRVKRLVPTASSSVRVSFLDANGAVLQTALLTRQSGRANGPSGGVVSMATFQNLPSGVLTVQAVAFPNADGSGIAQASVTGQATIVENQLTTINLTMNTTITRVEILPVIVQFTGNGSTTLTAAAYDAANNLVLTNQWQWANSDPSIINLVPNGGTADITPIGVGTTVVTLTETESGVSVPKILKVTANSISQ